MDSQDLINLNVSVLQTLTPNQAWKFKIVPKTVNGNLLEFYIDEASLFPQISDELEILFGKQIVLFPTRTEIILKTLGTYYRLNSSTIHSNNEKKITINNEDFLEKIISEARDNQSSDIHIEIYEDKARIRIRIDGKLMERYELTKNQYPALINKIKIKSNLDIAEKRLPQDGRILFSKNNTQFDIRVSIIPTLYGEKIVMRILCKDSDQIELNELGFSKLQSEHYLEAIKQTSGILLISGPTGSGKTTTLYATLRILNSVDLNILTVEDPIEYTLRGINQVQVKEAIGLTFASVLRTFLRQDPDIIMLGEIRDSETAQMAIRASLTGHLVLSTIHTNSALGTITRLIDMGIQPYLVSETLKLSVSQRLIRTLCPHCKQLVPFDASCLPKKFIFKNKITEQAVPRGCRECYYTGYKGRMAVFEVIPIYEFLMQSIKKNDLKIEKDLKELGISKLADSAINLFLQGKTSAEEVYPILLNNEY
jgi:type IV pilus assembly protein PilB